MSEVAYIRQPGKSRIVELLAHQQSHRPAAPEPFPIETLVGMQPLVAHLGEVEWARLMTMVRLLRVALPNYSEKTQVAFLNTSVRDLSVPVGRFIVFLALSKHTLPSYWDVINASPE